MCSGDIQYVYDNACCDRMQKPQPDSQGCTNMKLDSFLFKHPHHFEIGSHGSNTDPKSRGFGPDRLILHLSGGKRLSIRAGYDFSRNMQTRL